uniref:Shikimate 5-dehydrogenase n=1 Tax=uncultured Cytophagia bacterium TaxID=768505 RepID=H6REA6_9BACT|nr:shikimate 5-dehydrogenase [uncultured bacterium]CCF99367.1 shikimate 5-dehydrogenase [uncultured Cytophagia bacterium]
MKTYGLIGNSLSHSFSKKYFTEKFDKLGLTDSEYINIEIEAIEEFCQRTDELSPLGLNVTIPYKTAVIPFLDEIDEVAKEIGAVNTIVFKNGKLKGYNTDAFGFHQSIKPFFKPHHERALILGTGGASKAVEYVLKQYGVEVMFASRNDSKDNVLNWNDINENVIKHHLLIINCTPLGMFPNIASKPVISYSALTERHLLVDLIYNPDETLFLKLGKDNGAKVINGLTMLQQQAEKSWRLWND